MFALKQKLTNKPKKERNKTKKKNNYKCRMCPLGGDHVLRTNLYGRLYRGLCSHSQALTSAKFPKRLV